MTRRPVYAVGLLPLKIGERVYQPAEPIPDGSIAHPVLETLMSSGRVRFNEQWRNDEAAAQRLRLLHIEVRNLRSSMASHAPAIAEAQKRVAHARAEYERLERLASHRRYLAEDLQQAQHELRAAEAALERLETRQAERVAKLEEVELELAAPPLPSAPGTSGEISVPTGASSRSPLLGPRPWENPKTQASEIGAPAEPKGEQPATLARQTAAEEGGNAKR